MTGTLTEKLLLAVAGPLTAAVVGSLIIGLFVEWVTRRAQDTRLQYELRRELIGQMTESSSALVYAVAQYERATEGIFSPGSERSRMLQVLHDQYRDTRTRAAVVEGRLEAYFASELPRKHFHAAIDSLSVRYYLSVGKPSDALLLANAGPSHSGLSLQELRDVQAVRAAYRSAIQKATYAVLEERLLPVNRG